MICLSLWQPYATLCVTGAKIFETRPVLWRGLIGKRVAIHAAQKWGQEQRALLCYAPFLGALTASGDLARTMPRGAILGSVLFAGAYRVGRTHMELVGEAPGRLLSQYPPIPAQPQRAFGDYHAGRYAYALADPVRLAHPIDYAGQQGPFEVPDDLMPGGVPE